jgi:hypothetical protein
MAAELKVGDPAPDFKATAVGGIYGGDQEVSFATSSVQLWFCIFTPRTTPPGACHTIQA